jgi:hypothetical protein
MPLFHLLLLLTFLGLAYCEIFTVSTPFLAKNKHSLLFLKSDIITVADLRGGSDKYEKEEEETMDDEWEEYEDEEEEEADIVLTDGPEGETENDEVFVENFDDEEEEDDLVEEEEEEEPVLEERIPNDDENTASFVDTMEARIATTTDDENSYAFVDRMELADAYDEVDTTADPEDATLAAVTAATAIGGGDNAAAAVAVEEALAVASAEEELAEAAVEDPAANILEITDDMKKALKELKYKSREVALMRPDVAAELAGKGLQRPPEGIPKNWYIEGARPTTSLPANALKMAVALVALGGVTVMGLKGDGLPDVGGLLGAIPAVLKSMLPAKSASTSTPGAISSTTAVVEEVPQAEKEAKEDEDHPQSVKPFSQDVPAYEEDLDKSWLDKGITKIENLIKAFFNAKI